MDRPWVCPESRQQHSLDNLPQRQRTRRGNQKRNDETATAEQRENSIDKKSNNVDNDTSSNNKTYSSTQTNEREKQQLKTHNLRRSPPQPSVQVLTPTSWNRWEWSNKELGRLGWDGLLHRNLTLNLTFHTQAKVASYKNFRANRQEALKRPRELEVTLLNFQLECSSPLHTCFRKEIVWDCVSMLRVELILWSCDCNSWFEHFSRTSRVNQKLKTLCLVCSCVNQKQRQNRCKQMELMCLVVRVTFADKPLQKSWARSLLHQKMELQTCWWAIKAGTKKTLLLDQLFDLSRTYFWATSGLMYFFGDVCSRGSPGRHKTWEFTAQTCLSERPVHSTEGPPKELGYKNHAPAP